MKEQIKDSRDPILVSEESNIMVKTNVEWDTFTTTILNFMHQREVIIQDLEAIKMMLNKNASIWSMLHQNNKCIR